MPGLLGTWHVGTWALGRFSTREPERLITQEPVWAPGCLGPLGAREPGDLGAWLLCACAPGRLALGPERLGALAPGCMGALAPEQPLGPWAPGHLGA